MLAYFFPLSFHRFQKSKGSINETLDFAKECSHLHQHFQDAKTKIVENATETERPLVSRLVDVLDHLNQGLRDEEDKIQKKREQDRANRRSAAFSLQNGESKVSTKTLPQGPSSLAAIDTLLDDLESFHAQNSGDPAKSLSNLASRDLVRPANMQPPSQRPPELAEDDASKRVSRLPPAPVVTQSLSPSPQPQFQPPSPTASISGKSAIDSLDALLLDLDGAVLDLPPITTTASSVGSNRKSGAYSPSIALPPPIASPTPQPVRAVSPTPTPIPKPVPTPVPVSVTISAPVPVAVEVVSARTSVAIPTPMTVPEPVPVREPTPVTYPPQSSSPRSSRSRPRFTRRRRSRPGRTQGR